MCYCEELNDDLPAPKEDLDKFAEGFKEKSALDVMYGCIGYDGLLFMIIVCW